MDEPMDDEKGENDSINLTTNVSPVTVTDKYKHGAREDVFAAPGQGFPSPVIDLFDSTWPWM